MILHLDEDGKKPVYVGPPEIDAFNDIIAYWRNFPIGHNDLDREHQFDTIIRDRCQNIKSNFTVDELVKLFNSYY